MSKKKTVRGIVLFIVFFVCLKITSFAATIYTSPYVTFSPDRMAWTTDAWDTGTEWYSYGTTVRPGNGIHLSQAGVGQHTYQYSRSGSVPVGEWRVKWENGQCLHSDYSEEEEGETWHNLHYRTQSCGNHYYSGWIGYCADCGETVTMGFVYMSAQTARNLQYIEAGTDIDYYYLCPWCGNLEQGFEIRAHSCTGVSENMYRVRYQPNVSGNYSGTMQDSYHLYNNASVYEGKRTSCVGELSQNRYERPGYLFLGWNTRPDGSGRSFEDGEAILNLTSYDCNQNPSGGTITLYAQWKSYEDLIVTEKLSVSEGENVYYDRESGIYYVRSDGVTPFQLNFSAFLDINPPVKYWIRHGILECAANDLYLERTIYCGDQTQDAQGRIEASAIALTEQGKSILTGTGEIWARRSDEKRRLEIVSFYLLGMEDSGKRTEIVPRAKIQIGAEEFCSKKTKDIENGICVIADGTPPVFHGTDLFDGLNLIDRDEEDIITDIYASDEISGVKTIRLEIQNIDNGLSKFFEPDSDGHIRIRMTSEEPLFTGDFTVVITAADRVGNEAEFQYHTTEFAMHAFVERILDPHDAAFETGESGILSITTWGYADRVEVSFPEEFLEKNPKLNREYDYTGNREYRKDEALQFMVPLYVTESDGYEIIIRAYKGDKKLEEHPRIRILAVSGTVLDHFRTRLR